MTQNPSRCADSPLKSTLVLVDVIGAMFFRSAVHGVHTLERQARDHTNQPIDPQPPSWGVWLRKHHLDRFGDGLNILLLALNLCIYNVERSLQSLDILARCFDKLESSH